MSNVRAPRTMNSVLRASPSRAEPQDSKLKTQNLTTTYRSPPLKRLQRRAPKVIRFLTLVLISMVFAFPFYWVVLTSLLPQDHVFDFPPALWPQWDFANYATAWNAAPWGQYFLNTMYICIGTTAMVLVTSSLAGYCLATMVFPGKRAALGIIFGSLIMPAVVAIIPDYVIANW